MKPNLVALAAVGLGLVASLSSCQSWEESRRDIVDPVNQLVHRVYPKAFRGLDRAAVVSLFADDLKDWAAADVARMDARFDEVELASCVIHDATAPDGEGAVMTQSVLRLDGVKDGKKLTFEEERKITCRPIDGEWKITGVEVGHGSTVSTAARYSSEAEARGLIATNRSRGAESRTGEKQIYLGSGGVAVGDVDGDGTDDVLLLSGDRLRLFRNNKGQFQDITEGSGLVTPSQGECRCGYFADIDNDGDQDLLVAMFLGDVFLFENDGNGKFRRLPPEHSGIHIGHGQVGSACFGDFDNDGDLDLVVACGQNMYKVDPEPPENGRNAHRDRYFRNQGDGTFTDATEAAGLGGTGWALACAVSDYDRDGDLDLFIANDVGVDFMYRNRGDGTFEDVTEESGCIFPGSSMSADFGDVNGDGWPDLYVSGMASNSRWLLRQPGFPVPAAFPLDVLFRSRILDIVWQMLHGNRLYLNNRDGTFREASIETRSYWLGWAWSAVFLDHDNDSLLDIYVANGFWTGADPTDC